MNQLPLYAALVVFGAATTLPACSGNATSQEKANVAQAEATGAESSTAAQTGLTEATKTSQDDVAAATFKLASVKATTAHNVAIAKCAEVEAADRVGCTNKADDQLNADNQKAAAAQVTSDAAKPGSGSGQANSN